MPIQSPAEVGTKISIIALLVLFVFGRDSAVAQPDASKSATYVKITAVAGRLDESGMRQIEIRLDINEKVYLFAHQVGNENLATAQTTIRLFANGKPISGDITYPEGVTIKDDVVGD